MPRLMKEAMEGMIAGMMMAMVAMVEMMLLRRPAWKPVNLMAATFEGPAATRGGLGTHLLGGTIHMTMSALFALMFRPILRMVGWNGSPSLPIMGIGYALGLFTFNETVTLPIFDPAMARRMGKIPFVISHVIYGLTLGTLVGQLGPRVATGLMPTVREYVLHR